MAIRAIASNTVKSRTVLECKNIINSYSEYGSIRIIWVPAHCGVDVNEHVNDLAIKAREAEEVNLDNPKPFGATRSELKVWAKRAHVELWNSEIVGRTTKIIWGDPDEEKTKELLKESRSTISRVIGIITGHLDLRAHLNRIGVINDSLCRACGEDEETLEHYLCHCPAFTRYRSQHLGVENIPNLNRLKGVKWKQIKEFVENTEFLK
ncbi:uncharacterized protein LOC142224875 [Haematobia irritans]|uniref:uncharacterized protein LOC142224875 n=1 Tax=Haematobia irritans TaxID=7368 RepID=UPI003F50314B